MKGGRRRRDFKLSQKPPPAYIGWMEPMQERKTHNGFANYETWAVSLWMSNDRENYERYRDLARSVVTECTGDVQEFLSRKEAKALALAEALQDDFHEFSPVRRETSIYADLMNAAMEEVDWYELAEDLLNDIGES